MRVYNEQIITNGDMSADVVGPTMNLESILAGCAQCVWTSGATGTLKIQVSCDQGTDSLGTGVVTWSDLPTYSQALSGSAGNYPFNLGDAGYKWARVYYKFTSGTGTLNARFNGKGF